MTSDARSAGGCWLDIARLNHDQMPASVQSLSKSLRNREDVRMHELGGYDRLGTNARGYRLPFSIRPPQKRFKQREIKPTGSPKGIESNSRGHL